MRVLIAAGGIMEPEILQWMSETKDRFLYRIAVDGGIHFFEQTGIRPTHWIGDFDTVSLCDVQHDFIATTEIITFPTEKDQTDTEAALETAISFGADEVVILGATGGRLDHFLANLHILSIALKAGVLCYIMDARNKIWLSDTSFSMKKKEAYGRYVSFLPFTETVSFLTLEGFRYPLKDVVLKQGLSLGISNEMVEEEVNITFQHGILVVIQAKDE